MPEVVFLTTSLATGGVASAIRQMAPVLTQHGLSSEIWGLTDGQEESPTQPVPTRCLGLSRKMAHGTLVSRLATELAADRPLVLHAQCHFAHLLGAQAARRSGVPRVLVSFHDLRVGWRRARLCRQVAPLVDRVLVLNEYMRQLYAQRCRYPEEKLCLLPHTVDTARFQPRPRDREWATQLGLGPEQFVLGSVARLAKVKGYRYLIEALALLRPRLPQARLVLVGEGGERPALERLAGKLGVAKQVIWAGPQQDIPRWMSLFDVYVQPSLMESHGLALHEALAMAVPCVATTQGGPPELLAHGEAGVLVPPAQPRALAEAILDLANNPERARALSKAGRRRAVEEYSPERYAERLWGVYEELLNEGACPPLPHGRMVGTGVNGKENQDATG